jgi:hypothetical protein
MAAGLQLVEVKAYVVAVSRCKLQILLLSIVFTVDFGIGNCEAASQQLSLSLKPRVGLRPGRSAVVLVPGRQICYYNSAPTATQTWSL